MRTCVRAHTHSLSHTESCKAPLTVDHPTRADRVLILSKHGQSKVVSNSEAQSPQLLQDLGKDARVTATQCPGRVSALPVRGTAVTSATEERQGPEDRAART